MGILSFGGIRGRMALLVFMAVTLISALMFAIYLKERKLIRSHMEDDLSQLVGLIASDQEEFISQTRQILMALSRLPEVRDAGTEACPELLSNLVAEFPRYRNIGVIDPAGAIVCCATGVGGGLNFSREPWYTHAVASKDFSLGTFHSGMGDEPALTVGYPVHDKAGALTAVTFAMVDLAHFAQFVEHVRPPKAVEFILITRGGVIVNRHPDAKAHLVSAQGKGLLLQAMFRMGVGTIEAEGDDGLRRLYAFAPLCSSVDTGLFAAVGVPVSALFSPANRIVITQFAGLWIVTLVAISVIWFGSNALVIKPLNVMAATARRLTAGETSARTRLPYRGGEIGIMARSFDEMAETLERRDLELRRQKDQLRSFASQLSVAEERERRRIATDLHDRVGQLLALARMKLGMLGELAPSGEVRELAREVSGFLGEAIRDTRSLIFEISPPILYELGLEAALGYLVEQVRLRHGIAATYADDGLPKPLAEEVKVLMFRAAGELLLNAVKHAGAGHVRVSSRREAGDMVLRVEDDGVGFDVGAIGGWNGRPSGFGLFSIRERIDSMGGRIEIDSRPGSGTRITLTAPLEAGLEDSARRNTGEPGHKT